LHDKKAFNVSMTRYFLKGLQTADSMLATFNGLLSLHNFIYTNAAICACRWVGLANQNGDDPYPEIFKLFGSRRGCYGTSEAHRHRPADFIS
jgi:hypothetical protein